MMTISLWIDCQRTKINWPPCSKKSSRRSNNTRLPISRNRKPYRVVIMIIRVQIFCGWHCRPNLCRCDQVWLWETHLQAVGSGWKGVRCHHDGPSLETVHFPAFPRSSHPILQPGRWGNRADSSSFASEGGLPVYLGDKRKIPVECKRNVKKMGVQSGGLNKLGQEDSQREDRQRPWFLPSTRQGDLFGGL